MRKALTCAVLAAFAAGTAPALAQKSADTLRITWRDAVPDITPYYNQLRTGVVIGHQIWDSLVYRDPETFQIKPLLAESYKWVDETTLEFTLRNNVTFQNGDKLTADDVVYTINSIVADKQVSTPSNYAYLDHATKVDDTHVRIELKRVFPAALDYMAMTLYIMPKAYREKVGPQEYSQHPVAAGPYKVTKVNGVTEVDLERYDGYYPTAQKASRRSARSSSTKCPMRPPRWLNLLGDRADWIWKFSPDQFVAVNAHAEYSGHARRINARRVSQHGCGRTHRRRQSVDQGEGAPGDRHRDRSVNHGKAAHAGRIARDRHALLSDAVWLRRGCGGALSVRSGQGEADAGRRRLSQRLRHRTRHL